MAAPMVVAKGAGPSSRCASARSRASTACPIVENKPLAQALFKPAPKSARRFPAPLFGAVAEVLAYLVRIKQLML